MPRSVNVPASELLARVEAGTAPVIVDVRTKREYEQGHVPGALHIPFASAGARADEIPAGRGETVVVYCGHGPRAWLAGSALRRHGFTDIRYLDGHMSGWHKAGLPEEKELVS
jgi:rhodanese-related sulfurtransferase